MRVVDAKKVASTKRMGGRRPNQTGRPTGSRNKRTIALEEYCLSALKRAVPKDGELGALQFFQALYRDDGVPLNVRTEAAKTALPYESPRLASTEFTGVNGGPMVVQMANAHDQLLEKLGRSTVRVPDA